MTIRRAVKRVIPTPLWNFARDPRRRAELAEARLVCERHYLATAARRGHRSTGRILCYHSIGQREFGVNDVSPARFRRHIELALEAGHHFVPAAEIARTGGGPMDLAISFDDGLKSVQTIAAPILAEHRIPYIVFAVSDWSDMKHPWYLDRALGWRDLEGLLDQGAELGSHSVSHPDFATISRQQAVDELALSREVIRQRLGFAPNSFAIPFGQSGNWPADCAKAASDVGYDTVYAQAEETRSPGTVARTFVTKHDSDRIFRALLAGKYDRWEEWF